MPGKDVLTHPSVVQEAHGLWFQEKSEQWPGMAQTLKVEKILWTEKSLYQDVLVFQSTNHGTILVLDGAIQCSTKDEFSYQEMITHLALNSHPSPKNVLVIGGGDGGVLREVVKHPMVERATLVDIDEAVPRVSKQFLPQMAVGFDDPRTETLIMDGFEYLKEHKNKFDCIITDSSDPEGPAEVLFQKPYFELLNGALREGGVITTQGESIWLHADLIKGLRKTCKEIFPVVEYAYTTIPTYPSGQIGFMVCCKDKTRDVKTPVRSISQDEEMEKYSYYSQAIHKASFVLPNFAIKALQL